ncbi:alpha/beta fold hydrolase [Porticoccus sp. W117]|uniref:alpha/beta fold hydrolase n=1 Tax=Porticoccus sp. W117 TaxID=3054777 RepID=UPI0025971629|nr:alpha/beta fold hydrolase [Porticoccus sp. W117]MDM3869733.1 alpha/beta fold hydrolase [Porticoccus sp. W117]
MNRTVEEKQFTVAGRTLAARYWPATEGSGQPVIALHGWLDNANSFQPLAQLLPKANILSLDLAGHGHSQGRSADSGYNLWQDVWEILEVAQQMGWQRFHLLGHSRGAMIAVLLSASAAEKVSKLALIDGLVPLPIAEAEAPLQLAQAIADRYKYRDYRRRRYSTEQDALTVRMKGSFPLTQQAAELFAERGLGQDEEGYYWIADPRLQAASDVKYSDGQLRAFIHQVKAPVMLFLGNEQLDIKERLFASYWQQIKSCQKVVLDGGHHLHMEGAEQSIARQLSDFFDPTPSLRA